MTNSNTIRITDTASAFAYLDSVEHRYEVDPSDPERVLERWQCLRCSGTGYYGHFGVCFDCGGKNSAGVRRVKAVTKARRVKTNLAARARRERERDAKAERERQIKASARDVAAEALDALRGHFRGDSAKVENWDAFCEACAAFCEENMLEAEARFELNRAVRDLRFEECKARRERIEAEEAAERGPLVAGRRELQGEIVSCRYVDNGYSHVLKGLVVLDSGHKVWGNVDRAFMELRLDDERDLPGARVAFKATVEVSEDDDQFGFFKRPANWAVEAA